MDDIGHTDFEFDPLTYRRMTRRFAVFGDGDTQVLDIAAPSTQAHKFVRIALADNVQWHLILDPSTTSEAILEFRGARKGIAALLRAARVRGYRQVVYDRRPLLGNVRALEIPEGEGSTTANNVLPDA